MYCHAGEKGWSLHVCDSGLGSLEFWTELLLVREETSGFDQKLFLQKCMKCYMAGDTGGRTWSTEVHLLLRVKETCFHKDFIGDQGFTWSGFSKLKVTWGCWGREDYYLGEFLHEFSKFLLMLSVALCVSFPPAF